MHILLTDRLACPRCGPDFGLVLLADRMEDRRVHEGRLGCPNCRDKYPVVEGFGDLRPPPRTPLEGAAEDLDTPGHDEVMRLAAFLGVAEGPGHLALLGRLAAFAEPLAEMLDEVEVVAVGPWTRNRPERPGVSRLAAGSKLPFFSRSLRGVAVSGEEAQRHLDEAVRVTSDMARVVVVDAPADTAHRLDVAGLEVVLDEQGVVVASRQPRTGGRAGSGVALPVFPGPEPETP